MMLKSFSSLFSVSCALKYDTNEDIYERPKHSVKIVWRNVIAMLIIHIAGTYGWYRFITGDVLFSTLIYSYIIGVLSGFGILVGAHRLWSHRSFKAQWQLRLILMIMQTVALQNDIYEWCRDHRVHHKYSETDADPHNSKRGFFFAHIGWLLCRKHPQVKEKGKHIDMSDLWNDPIVRFQRKFYVPLVVVFWGIIPIAVPIYLFNESLLNSILMNFFRYMSSLHQTWLVNSAAHIWGKRPYDKHIRPRENASVVYLSMGEGYHNYHHTFPWDYSASEFGWNHNFNPATGFIDLFAMIGWAYDRKCPSLGTVERRMNRTGDRDTVISEKGFWYDTTIGLVSISWPIWGSSLLKVFCNYQ